MITLYWNEYENKFDVMMDGPTIGRISLVSKIKPVYDSTDGWNCMRPWIYTHTGSKILCLNSIFEVERILGALNRGI